MRGGRKKCGASRIFEVAEKLAEKIQAEIRQGGGNNREGGGDFNNPLNLIIL